MSLYEKGEPAGIARFRRNTAGHAVMEGVAIPRFTCRCCGKWKPTEGRKRLTKYHRDGYKCADCASV